LQWASCCWSARTSAPKEGARGERLESSTPKRFTNTTTYVAARHSQLVYRTPKYAEKTLKSWGYDTHRTTFYDHKGTQAYVTVDPHTNRIIVAFRGTQPNQKEDLLADADIRRDHDLHRGFRRAEAHVSGKIRREVA
jgi:hypothetical protein